MRFALCCVTLLSTLAVSRGEDLPADEAIYKASTVPDRILLSWKGDPARSASVSWRTAEGVEKTVAEIAEAGPSPNFAKGAKALAATTQALETNLGTALHHAATFEGLRADTTYAYRVGNGEVWSEWFQFRTASEKPAPLQFVYVGDAQVNLKSLWSRAIRQAYSDAPKATFFLHAGDLVNRGDADHEWGQWFYSLGWTAGTVPQIAVPGNHEYSLLKERPKGEEKRVTGHWRTQFELPENGPMGLEETCFFVDVQGVRLVALNSNEEQEMQVEWLESVLKENPNRWTVVTHHHPIHSTGKDRDNAALRKLWQPVYDRYGVDLVLQGHDHTYGRTGPTTFDPKEAQVSTGDEKNVPTGVRGRSPGGTVYVVSVSGPKMYELKAYPPGEGPFRRMAADTQLYQVITIDGDELKYEARTATGSPYDGFTLRKRDGQANEMVEQVPAGVEERVGDVKD